MLPNDRQSYDGSLRRRHLSLNFDAAGASRRSSSESFVEKKIEESRLIQLFASFKSLGGS